MKMREETIEIWKSLTPLKILWVLRAGDWTSINFNKSKKQKPMKTEEAMNARCVPRGAIWLILLLFPFKEGLEEEEEESSWERLEAEEDLVSLDGVGFLANTDLCWKCSRGESSSLDKSTLL